MTELRAVLRALLPPIVTTGLRRLIGPRIPQTVGQLPAFVSETVSAYAQYGEDLIIDAVLGCPDSGFYVDVGANDPSLLSNTRRFYDRGWHGISVEADPRLCARLASERPRDTILNVGVASANSTASFYRLDPDTLSTFDPVAYKQALREYPGTRLVEVLEVQIVTLDEICRSYLAPGQAIDFLSVDVEGTDLSVLKGNDWRVTRPALVLVEINRGGTEIVDFMRSVHYDFVWCNGTNGLFRTRTLDDVNGRIN